MWMNKRALICGIGGQDGSYLAKFLLSKGYDVYGTSRDAELSRFDNLLHLGIRDQLNVKSMALSDFRSVLTTLTSVRPDEIYNLAGQSSVGLSFDQPVETMESISLGVLNLLEAVRFTGGRGRVYNASSSECFGDTHGDPASEETPFRPRSPYAVAKSAAHWTVVNYRQAYGLFACNGILFNHESPLRPRRFVTRKIVAAACAIRRGEFETLQLGDIDISRDWGSAQEYVQAMWRMMQVEQADDYIIATGETNSLKDFVSAAFEAVGLDWTEHVKLEPHLVRPSEIRYSSGNPQKAMDRLGWKADLRMRDVVREMVTAELA